MSQTPANPAIEAIERALYDYCGENNLDGECHHEADADVVIMALLTSPAALCWLGSQPGVTPEKLGYEQVGWVGDDGDEVYGWAYATPAERVPGPLRTAIIARGALPVYLAPGEEAG